MADEANTPKAFELEDSPQPSSVSLSAQQNDGDDSIEQDIVTPAPPVVAPALALRPPVIIGPAQAQANPAHPHPPAVTATAPPPFLAPSTLAPGFAPTPAPAAPQTGTIQIQLGMNFYHGTQPINLMAAVVRDFVVNNRLVRNTAGNEWVRRAPRGHVPNTEFDKDGRLRATSELLPYYCDLRMLTRDQWIIMAREHYVRIGHTAHNEASLSLVKGRMVGFVQPPPAGYDYAADLLPNLFPDVTEPPEWLRSPGTPAPTPTFPTLGTQPSNRVMLQPQTVIGPLPPTVAVPQASGDVQDTSDDDSELTELTTGDSNEGSYDSTVRGLSSDCDSETQPEDSRNPTAAFARPPPRYPNERRGLLTRRVPGAQRRRPTRNSRQTINYQEPSDTEPSTKPTESSMYESEEEDDQPLPSVPQPESDLELSRRLTKGVELGGVIDMGTWTRKPFENLNGMFGLDAQRRSMIGPTTPHPNMRPVPRLKPKPVPTAQPVPTSRPEAGSENEDDNDGPGAPPDDEEEEL